jgi:hypothetical protein
MNDRNIRLLGFNFIGIEIAIGIEIEQLRLRIQQDFPQNNCSGLPKGDNRRSFFCPSVISNRLR